MQERAKLEKSDNMQGFVTTFFRDMVLGRDINSITGTCTDVLDHKLQILENSGLLLRVREEENKAGEGLAASLKSREIKIAFSSLWGHLGNLNTTHPHI